jgi:CubicO group peptidase (beta-lactamase class C family)
MAVSAFGAAVSAQQPTFTFSLFERYLEALRVEAGIPGLSATVLQGGTALWEKQLGYADVESAIPPRVDTPYPLGGMSQILGSTLVLELCVEDDARDPNNLVTDWIPAYPDPSATLVRLLAHVDGAGAYKYDLGQFSWLTSVAEQCEGRTPYARLLAEGFTQLGLADSVPGTALATPTTADFELFEPATLARYRDVLGRMPIPYRVDTRGRASRSEPTRTSANAATGAVMSLQDLAKFDAALHRFHVLQPATLQRAWTRPAPHLPTGLGWFLQNYNGQAVVWQFGIVPDAYSSLIVKLPNRNLTFILLANSDGLSAPFPLEQGDVTASLFARTFLRFFVP